MSITKLNEMTDHSIIEPLTSILSLKINVHYILFVFGDSNPAKQKKASGAANARRLLFSLGVETISGLW